MRVRGIFGRLAALLILVCAAASRAPAQTVEEFYRGKTVAIVLHSEPGSSYDIYARLLARHMPRFVPGNPGMIVRNMPGAGGLTATRFLYTNAPRDGLTIGTTTRGIPFEPLLGATTFDFNPLNLSWIGSMNKETTIYVATRNGPAKTAEDMRARGLLVAGTGAGADSEVVSNTLNGIVGTKIRLISGYHGTTDAALALERGEIEGVYISWSGVKTGYPQWIRDGKINVLLQTRATPHPDLPDTPLVMSLTRNDEERQALALLFARDVLGRPFFAPPGVPADRSRALREAFNAAVKSSALLEEAEKLKLEIELVTAAEIETLIASAYATPTPIVERLKKAMARAN